MIEMPCVIAYETPASGTYRSWSRTGRDYQIFDKLCKSNVQIVVWDDPDIENGYFLVLRSEAQFESVKKALLEFCGEDTLVAGIPALPVGLHINPLHTKFRISVKPANVLTLANIVCGLRKAIA